MRGICYGQKIRPACDVVNQSGLGEAGLGAERAGEGVGGVVAAAMPPSSPALGAAGAAGAAAAGAHLLAAVEEVVVRPGEDALHGVRAGVVGGGRT